MRRTSEIAGWARDVAVANGYAYVAEFAGGLRIIDVRDPLAPKKVGQYVDDVESVAVHGGFAYVGTRHAFRVLSRNHAVEAGF
jgi:hypothetical protein